MIERTLPWAIAAIAVAGAAWTIAGRSGASSTTRGETPGADSELRTCRVRVASLESESQLLRVEIDRLRNWVQAKKSTEARDTEAASEQSPAEQRARTEKALARLADLVPELQTGREDVFVAMRDVFHDLARAPLDDPSPFRERYAEADDPTLRRILLSHVVVRDRAGAPAFLLEELQRAGDPELRADMIEDLRGAADAKDDAEARSVLLASLGDESLPRARRAAVEALAGVPGQLVQDSLVEVALRDPDPTVRELAIRKLAENPDTRGRVIEMLAREPDERLRTVGECTAKLASYSGAS